LSHLSDPDKTLEIEIFVSLAKKTRRQDSTKQKTVLGPWCRIYDQSHVMFRAANIAPRVATNFRPALRQNLRHSHPPIQRYLYLATPTPSRCITGKYTARTVIARERSAPYATMAAATSFYEFKPKDSTSPHDSPHISSTGHGHTIRCVSSIQPLTTSTEKGSSYDLNKLDGKVVLVVNTASKCGFTPQFEGLEKLYKEMKGKHPNDFEIIGFPCNQFGGQDPGSNDEIQEFCQLNYGVSFPVLGKIDVSIHPSLLYHTFSNLASSSFTLCSFVTVC
jgi:glutathione peroxidase-family protein